jgi:hypothetical protein
MGRSRFSIASLLGVILFISVALAALRASTDAWDGCLLGLAVMVLLTAILLAIHRRDRKRAYWLGFSLFGWVYLLVSLIPPLESRLPMTRGLAYLRAARPVAIPQGVAVADFDSDGQLDLYLVADSSAPNAVYLNNGNGTFRVPTSTNVGPGGKPAPSVALWKRLMGIGGSSENFVRIGHSILALVFASFGGSLSRRLCHLDIPRPEESSRS